MKDKVTSAKKKKKKKKKRFTHPTVWENIDFQVSCCFGPSICEVNKVAGFSQHAYV